jgi:signal transduction histidine kinase
VSKGRSYSITKKLTMMNMLVSGIALLLACAGFAGYEVWTIRNAMVRNLSIQAQIVGSNSASALLFNDPHSAEATLAALKAAPHIISAGIYKANGRPFAGYWRDKKGSLSSVTGILKGGKEAYWFQHGELILVRSIIFQNHLTGIVVIRSDLKEITKYLERYAAITAMVLPGCLLAVFFISSLARRTIAEPVLSLAEAARAVSRHKDYAVRAPTTDNCEEFGSLVHSFNEMLEEIQKRDSALQQARDLLEQRVSERTAELEAANKELEAFSYSVSHDLRAPLRQIDGFSVMLMEHFESQPDATVRRYLKLIRSGVLTMGQLVDDLLNMGRISRQELARKPTDLNALVQKVVRELQPETEGRQIDWRIGTLPEVDCDPGLIKQVVQNLLSNAVKYTRQRTRAVIEVGQMMAEEETVIFVRDNGAGFDQKYAHKLFGVFQRLHRSEDFEGTGVGLAIVQRIVQKHGGRAWGEGKVGEGATIYFTVSGNGLTRPSAKTFPERKFNNAT